MKKLYEYALPIVDFKAFLKIFFNQAMAAANPSAESGDAVVSVAKYFFSSLATLLLFINYYYWFIYFIINLILNLLFQVYINHEKKFSFVEFRTPDVRTSLFRRKILFSFY